MKSVSKKTFQLGIATLTVVAIPLLFLTWAVLTVKHNESNSRKEQYQELVKSRLSEQAALFEVFLKEKEARLEVLLNQTAANSTALRELVLNQPGLRSAFLLNNKGSLLHPLEDPTKSSKDEMGFLNRIQGVVDSGALLQQNQEEFQASSRLGKKGSLPQIMQKQTFNSFRQVSGWWHSFYWDNGIQLLYLAPRGEETVGVELMRSDFISNLIPYLESRRTLSKELKGVWRLEDSQGQIIHQWGAGVNQNSSKEIHRISLPMPLGAWSLSYHSDFEEINQFINSSRDLTLFMLLAMIVIGSAGLGYYIYREHSRAITEALTRTTFVNQVSHELKTPLTSIRLYAELLKEALPEEEEKQHRQLAVILSQSERLSRLIANILSFQSYEKGKLKLTLQRVRPREVIEQTLLELAPELSRSGIMAHLIADEIDQPVLLDRDVLKQILGNLLTNACKYATNSGELEIKLLKDTSFITIIVSDHGPGIPAENSDEVFRPFFRVSNKLTEGVSGAGIGLSISRQLAELHQGSLELLPTEQGASFEIKLRIDGEGI